MELPSDIPTVMNNASNYFMMHGSEIPEFQRGLIVERTGPGLSPVDYIVTVAEALYAVADVLDNEGREISAQAANLAALNGWYGMRDRGFKMVNSLKRMNGETTDQPEADDPIALDQYMVKSGVPPLGA